MSARLTIAIPTFDRNELLAKHVALLLPQLTAETRLVVFDNASPTPVAETLAELLREYPAAPVEIVRHRVNIGSSANVMRCLETCPTPWLWILGDDDRPLPDAVATVLAETQGDALLINFVSMHETVSQDRETRGLADFVHGIPNFANLTLISNNVIRADRLSAHVRIGYFYAYSLFPHLACVLTALKGTDAVCRFSPKRLVDWGPASEWSRVMAGLGIGILLDLPLPTDVRKALVPAIVGVGGRFSSLAIHLLARIGRDLDAATARHLYDQAWHRLYKQRWRPLQYFVWWTGFAMLCFPRMSLAAYRIYRRWRGSPLADAPTDEMRRM